jgi:hypothetical protein
MSTFYGKEGLKMTKANLNMLPESCNFLKIHKIKSNVDSTKPFYNHTVYTISQ